ncbi:TonB family protein [Planctobacterium marinum]|uniref:TonB C-terminal domain-containing protein n=1 Tax=Planctobacterium marinum TaxID=1631968 RepID=A0AA48HR01_9ALTE|nr:hypothetical protein MACH26_35680 [Planctobacterium marinum]
MDWLNLIANSSVLHALAHTLVHFAWQGLLLALVLFLLLKNIPSRYAQLRYSISLFTLVLCVVVPVATFSLLYTPEISFQAIDMQQVVTGVSGTVAQFGEALTESGVQSVSFATAEFLDFLNVQLVHGVLPFLALCWIAGVLLLSVRVALQMVGVCQLPHQSTYLPEPQLQQLFEGLLHKLEVNPVTRLLISDKVDVPMAIGWLKPVVLLPSSMVVGLTPGQLEMLLMHELAHVRRHDYIINFFQTLVELLLFFHPAVRWVSGQIRMERECCCDDIAVAHVGNPVAYATTLTDAEMSRFQNIPELAMAASGSDLKSRILRVVGQTDCANGNARLRKSGLVAALCSVSVVLLILVTDNASEQHVSATQPDVQDEQLLEVAETAATVTARRDAIEAESPDPSVALNSGLDVANESVTQPAEKLVTPVNAEPDTTQDVEVAAVVQTSSSSGVSKLASGVIETDDSELTDNEQHSESAKGDSEDALMAELPAVDAAQEIVKQQPDFETGAEKSSLSVDIDLPAAPELSVVPDLASASVSTEDSVEQTMDSMPETGAIAKADDSESPEQSITTTIAAAKTPVQEPETTVISPVLLKGEAPVYPRQALRRGLTDQVQVSFKVNTRGQVEDIAFRGSVHRSFKKSVRRALAQWQFQPGIKNGEETVMTMQHVFSFAEPENAVLATTGTRIDAK